MQSLAQIFAVTFPFFALVLCGYLAARSRVLPLNAVPGLNSFVLYFALPCMLFRFGRTTPLAELLDPVTCAIWLSVGLLIVGMTVGWSRRAGHAWPDAAMGALVAAFPNSGFMGVPLILALLGPQAMGPVMSTLLMDLVVLTSLCIGLSQWSAPGEHGSLAAGFRALKGVLRNPMPWAIVLGASFGAGGLSLWAPLDQTVELLAASASPVALFTIGAVLARARLHPPSASAVRQRETTPAWHGGIAMLVVCKLLLHPALIFGAGALAIAAGGLRDEALAALVMTAALPSASNVSLLAERFGADNGRIARIILWSTTGAFLTFSGIAAIWLHA